MEIRRLENSKRNMIFGLVNRGTLILFPFLNRTVLLYVLGQGYLGLNGLFSSILNVLSLTELGFGSALVFCMYKPIAQNDEQTICVLLNLYKKIYRCIGALISVFGIMLLPFLNVLIEGEIPDGVNIYVIFCIQLLDTVLSYFLFAYKSALLSAFQREDIISRITMVVTICQYSIQFVIVYLFHNYYLYLIITPIMTIARNIWQCLMVNRMFPCYVCKGSPEKEQIRVLMSKVKALFMHKVGGIIANSLDNIVVSAFLGLSMVAVFGNYMYIYTSVMGLMNVFYTSILAGVGNSMVCENVEKNYKNFIQVNLINLWMTGWCSITILCLYQPFMKLWAGNGLLLQQSTVILLIVYFYINMSRRIVVVYRDAAGIWEKDRFVPLISGVVNVVLNIILIQVIGINGVVISTMIAFMVVEIPWQLRALYLSYFQGYHVGEYIKIQMWFAVVTVFVGAITYNVVSFVQATGMKELIVNSAICIVLPNIFYVIVCGRQFRFILNYLKRRV